MATSSRRPDQAGHKQTALPSSRPCRLWRPRAAAGQIRHTTGRRRTVVAQHSRAILPQPCPGQHIVCIHLQQDEVSNVQAGQKDSACRLQTSLPLAAGQDACSLQYEGALLQMRSVLSVTRNQGGLGGKHYSTRSRRHGRYVARAGTPTHVPRPLLCAAPLQA